MSPWRRLLPLLLIGLLALAPVRGEPEKWAADIDRLIAAECATEPRCTLVDVATPLLDGGGATRPELYVEDGVHLRPEGCRIWTAVLGPVLAR